MQRIKIALVTLLTSLPLSAFVGLLSGMLMHNHIQNRVKAGYYISGPWNETSSIFFGLFISVLTLISLVVSKCRIWRKSRVCLSDFDLIQRFKVLDLDSGELSRKARTMLFDIHESGIGGRFLAKRKVGILRLEQILECRLSANGEADCVLSLTGTIFPIDYYFWNNEVQRRLISESEVRKK